MMDSSPRASHLSEDDRQRAADGSLDAADRARVDAHLASCADCAADVARLSSLMNHLREAPAAASPNDALDALWPEIRRRIEGAKIVPLDAPAVARRQRRTRPWIVGLAAAAATVAAVAIFRAARPAASTPPAAAAASSDSLFRLASDSAAAYADEATKLLDELQVERSLLPPETRASIDQDLKTIDSAIAELQVAIARDPKNAALRSLLAASFREKVNVLKRISNAG